MLNGRNYFVVDHFRCFKNGCLYLHLVSCSFNICILMISVDNCRLTQLQDGSTCAHIAAGKGSVSVLEELMKFDKNVVTNSRNKLTDSTPLHIATEGGHFDVVKMLMDSGASASDENKVGQRQHVLSLNFHTVRLSVCAEARVLRVHMQYAIIPNIVRSINC